MRSLSAAARTAAQTRSRWGESAAATTQTTAIARGTPAPSSAMRASTASSSTPLRRVAPAGTRSGPCPRSASTMSSSTGMPGPCSTTTACPVTASAPGSNQSPASRPRSSRTASSATPARRGPSSPASRAPRCAPTSRPSSPTQSTTVGRKRSGTTLATATSRSRTPPHQRLPHHQTAFTPLAPFSTGTFSAAAHRAPSLRDVGAAGRIRLRPGMMGQDVGAVARVSLHPRRPRVARAGLVTTDDPLRQRPPVLQRGLVVGQRVRVHHQPLHLAAAEDGRLALSVRARGVAEPRRLMVQELAHAAVGLLEEVGDRPQADGMLPVDHLHAMRVYRAGDHRARPLAGDGAEAVLGRLQQAPLRAVLPAHAQIEARREVARPLRPELILEGDHIPRETPEMLQVREEDL